MGVMLTGLNLSDRSILAFEAAWTRTSGDREYRIRSELGLSKTRYYQLLNRILDDPEASKFDPTNVHRLRKLRAERAAGRASRLF